MDIKVKQSPDKEARNIRLIVPLDSGDAYTFKGKTLVKIVELMALKIRFQRALIDQLENQQEQVIQASLHMLSEDMQDNEVIETKKEEIESGSE